MQLATTILVWAIIAHAIADWLLQNEWMAKNKTSLRHPAGYVHGLIYMICLMGVYPFWAALIVSITHILIDTRKPLQWWRRIFKRTPNAEGRLPDIFRRRPGITPCYFSGDGNHRQQIFKSIDIVKFSWQITVALIVPSRKRSNRSDNIKEVNFPSRYPAMNWFRSIKLFIGR